MTQALRSAQFSDWDLYCFGVSLGLRTLPRSLVEGLKRLILPVEYIRCAESRYVLTQLDAAPEHRILDIGSPKLLSLFLAARVGARVHATDLADRVLASSAIHAACILSGDQARYQLEAQDAQMLTYPDNAFDRIFSISVLEHIPNDGDTAAMRQIARVLKPGGRVCLTMPWSDAGYVEEFKRRGDPDAYWVDSDEERVFYQRAYDRETLERRILSGNRLDVIDISYWGERRLAVEDALLNRKLPQLARWAMLPAHFPLSRLFLRPLNADEHSRKKVVCLTLQKRRPS